LLTRDSKPLTRDQKRGFGLVLVLGFATVLAVFTAAIGAQAAFNLNSVSRKGQSDQAYYGAYTAIQMSVAMLKEPPVDMDFDDDGISGDSWLEIDRRVLIGMPNGVTAASRLYHNLEGFAGGVTDTAALDDDDDPLNVPPDGTIVPPEHFYIMAVGETESGIRAEEVTMGATLAPKFPILNHAAFGVDSLDIDGRIDHFDSSASDGKGPWTDILVPPLDTPFTSLDQPLANVATNNEEPTQPGAVTLGSNARINGWLLFDEGATSNEITSFLTAPQGEGTTSGSPATYNIGSYGATGTGHELLNGWVSKQNQNKRLPVIEAPRVPGEATLLGGGAGASYSVPGSGLVLAEGTDYLVEGSFICGSSSIVIDDTDDDGKLDPVRIYVKGPQIRFSGSNNVNRDCPPGALKFYAAGECELILEDSEIFALLAGYEMDVRILADSQLWGSVLGRSVSLADTGMIHFDTALLDASTVAGTFDFNLSGTATTMGAVKSAQTLAPPPAGSGFGAPPPPPGPPPPGPPPPAPPPTGGVGCGGGSMLMQMK